MGFQALQRLRPDVQAPLVTLDRLPEQLGRHRVRVRSEVRRFPLHRRLELTGCARGNARPAKRLCLQEPGLLEGAEGPVPQRPARVGVHVLL